MTPDRDDPLPELKRVLLGDVLEEEAAEALMDRIMAGEATPAQIGAFLGTYKLRQPTTNELAGFARSMRAAGRQVEDRPDRLMDTCGTGGALVKSFNVSTTAGFIVAGAGVPVAKHGNRSVTSPSGSADVLEALGADIELDPEGISALLGKVGFAFLFAPTFHPAMKHAAGPRSELGVPTVFNILGPLTNPSKPTHQLIGVGRPELVREVAETMRLVGIDGVVVHGAPGFDEVSIVGPTRYAHVTGDEIETGHLTPAELGVESADVSEVKGVPPDEAADLLRDILAGQEGPRTEMVLAEAGVALWGAEEVDDPAEGVELAREVLEDGRALDTLESYIEASNEV
jgi:anthranilate phosphoribosyltransferase